MCFSRPNFSIMSDDYRSFAKTVQLSLIFHIANAKFRAIIIFWSTILIILLGVTVYQVFGLVVKLKANGVLTSIIISTQPAKPFPALTICSLNPYKLSAVENLTEFQPLFNAFGNGQKKKKRQISSKNILPTDKDTAIKHRQKRATVCPTGYISHYLYPEICYGGTFSNFLTTKTFPAAQLFCNTSNPAATLPIFHNVDEYTSYAQLMLHNTSAVCGDRLWLGISPVISSRWLDNTIVTLPNYWVGSITSGYCVTHHATGGYWQSYSCTTAKQLVCQIRFNATNMVQSTSPAPTGNCPSGWLSDSNGICYMYVNTPDTWDCAEAYCESLDATLPRFNNISERLSYNSLLPSWSLLISCTDHQWLGFWAPTGSSNYQWINGSTVPIDNNWNPNNSGPGYPRGVSYGWYSIYNSSYTAASLTTKYAYLCQMRPNSNPFNSVIITPLILNCNRSFTTTTTYTTSTTSNGTTSLTTDLTTTTTTTISLTMTTTTLQTADLTTTTLKLSPTTIATPSSVGITSTSVLNDSTGTFHEPTDSLTSANTEYSGIFSTSVSDLTTTASIPSNSNSPQTTSIFENASSTSTYSNVMSTEHTTLPTPQPMSTSEYLQSSGSTSKNISYETDQTTLEPLTTAVVLGYTTGPWLAELTTIQASIPYMASQTPLSLRTQYSYSLTDFLIHCSFDQVKCTEKDFVTWNDAGIGNCFTFNHENGIQHSSKNPGSNYGLELVFNASGNNELLPTTESSGFLVFATYNKDTVFPNLKGFVLPPNYILEIALEYKLIQRLKSPYGNCITKKSSSNFFYDSEYSVEGCLNTCYQKLVITNCKCGDPSYPLPPNSSQSFAPCSLEKKTCVDLVSNAFSRSNDNCSCYQPCLDHVFTAVSTLAKTRNFLELDSSQSIALVKAYHQRISYISFIENPAYDIVSFFNDFSNDVGNNLEIAFHSVFELLMILFLMLTACCYAKKIGPSDI